MTTFKRLLKYLRGGKYLFAAAIIAAAVSSAAALSVPVLIGKAIDEIAGQGSVDIARAGVFAVWCAVLVIISALSSFILGLTANKIAYNTAFNLRTDLEEKIHKLPVSFYDAVSKGDIVSRVSADCEYVSDGLLQGSASFLTGVMTIVGTIAVMLALNVKLAVTVIVITPLSLLAAYIITGRSRKTFSHQANLRGRLSGVSEEAVRGQKIIKAFSYEERSKNKFKLISRELRGVTLKAQFYSAAVNPVTRFVNNLVYVFTGAVGLLIVINGGAAGSAVGAAGGLGGTAGAAGGITVGVVAAFLTYAGQYTKPFNEITSVISELQTSLSSARRVFTLLDSFEEEEHTSRELTLRNGAADFSHIVFGYNDEKMILKDITFSAFPGRRIAVVGPTGCGKTTLINLLMRFYEPRSGVISVDNENIADCTRASVRGAFGMVLQDTFIFSGSVFENIAYGSENPDREAVENAAKLTGAHSFIHRLECGYDTIVDDSGGLLSAGQKQLICITRVMLRRPPMLILDEATSSIDTLSEQKVGEAFAKLMEGRTSFIIAHRLSTIRGADYILVMNDGRLIEQGNHRELIEKNGFYAQMYRS
jgi:ATP-binding cassette subfamily B protein